MKIALIEDKDIKLDLSEFDKVISFCRDEHINVSNYISEDEYWGIYDNVYNELNRWLLFQGQRRKFFYRDIDLLWAYGKRVFDFLFNLCQKLYVVENIIRTECPSELYVEKEYLDKNLKYPYLNFFISDFAPKDVAVKCFKQNGNRMKRDKKYISRHKKVVAFLLNSNRRLFNSFLSTDNECVVINADLSKVYSLFDYMDAKKIIFLRRELPERLVPFFLKKKIRLSLLTDFIKPKNDKKGICSILVNNLGSVPDILNIDGRDFRNIVSKFVKELWQKELTHILSEIDALNIFFEKHKPKALLLDEDRVVGSNIMVQTARLYGVKSYVNCHGDPFHKIGYLPLSADFIFVWGNMQKEIFKNWGIDEKRIIVTGSSKYDGYSDKPNLYFKQNLTRDLGLVQAKPLILFATCPLKKGRNVLEKNIWDDIKNTLVSLIKLNKAFIIIKLHPGDDNEENFRLLTSENENVIILKDYDPLKLTKAADILVVHSSTFCVDGLALKKPVIVTDRFMLDRYSSLDFFYDGTDIQGLSELVDGILNGRLLKHKQYWQYAAEQCLCGMKGSSANRISEILKNA